MLEMCQNSLRDDSKSIIAVYILYCKDKLQKKHLKALERASPPVALPPSPRRATTNLLVAKRLLMIYHPGISVLDV